MKLVKVSETELRLDEGGDDIVSIQCDDGVETANMIARAVNLYPALVSALTPFRSVEMGNLLVETVDIREKDGEQAQKNLARMIAIIDVVLDAAEAEPTHAEH